MKTVLLVAIPKGTQQIPIMKKASAIVTNQGGITSHAAVLAREFGIPCIVGTNIATEVFKDGDLVEVDADSGIIKKLSKRGIKEVDSKSGFTKPAIEEGKRKGMKLITRGKKKT